MRKVSKSMRAFTIATGALIYKGLEGFSAECSAIIVQAGNNKGFECGEHSVQPSVGHPHTIVWGLA